MTAYYNEIEPYCVQWLKNLIAEKLIAPGDVDDRDIRDVRPADLKGYTQCHFFAGIGGWSLALRLAGVGDNEPLWTGSCPCQPFSAAGKRGGFADERHLWPSFYHLVAQCRPPILFGEQVASAADWLRLVRGDLEALDYAVGAIPVEAASAGADHLRDRYWFVADSAHERIDRPRSTGPVGRDEHSNGRLPDGRSGRCPGSSERKSEQSGRAETIGAGNSGVAQGDADDARSQGRIGLRECADQRLAGQTSMADTNGVGQGNGELQRSGQFLWPRGDQEARAGNLPHAFGAGLRGERPGETAAAESGVQGSNGERKWLRPDARSVRLPEQYEWVIGADGKARRVKSGVRLLAHGVPSRVAKLRAFGNAIVPTCAAKFIEASLGLAQGVRS